MSDPAAVDPPKQLDFAERYIRMTKILAVILVPIVIILFSFVSFERKVVLDGEVLSPKQILVRSAIKDTLVKKVFVESGDRVTQGQVITEFQDVAGWANQLSVADLDVGVQLAALASYSNMNYDSLDKVMQKAEMERLRLAVAQTQYRLADLKEKVRLLRSEAPFDGEIVKVQVQDFDRVDVGTPIYEVARTDEFYVKAWIPEKLYSLVAKGNKVYLKSNLWNYLWYQIFHGEITYLSQFAQRHPVSGEIVFETHIKVLDGIDLMRVNTSVKCEIVRDRVGLLGYVFQTRPQR
ncbi:MAG: HlyD family efflux transporter periplasmic adaptor subunit [Spirochaetes bacterium]|nr:HlyD family efflux transporter periplasmic adaptor subunit [Spirochaetota bacterium]